MPLEFKLSDEINFNLPDPESLALLEDSDASSRDSYGDHGIFIFNQNVKINRYT